MTPASNRLPVHCWGCWEWVVFLTRSRSGVRPCVASHMFCIFLRYTPHPQSRCPCNCQVMFRLQLLLYCHYSCSGLMRLPIVATGLAAFQKRGPPSIHYTQAAFTKVCISRQSSSVFILCFFLLNQSRRGTLETFFSAQSDLCNPSLPISDIPQPPGAHWEAHLYYPM